jgi:hypothetical protein
VCVFVFVDIGGEVAIRVLLCRLLPVDHTQCLRCFVQVGERVGSAVYDRAIITGEKESANAMLFTGRQVLQRLGRPKVIWH